MSWSFGLRDITDVITIIAGIGTFISAVVAAYTIKEIKRQRESSYRPDIFLDSYTAYLYGIPFLKTENKNFEFEASCARLAAECN